MFCYFWIFSFEHTVHILQFFMIKQMMNDGVIKDKCDWSKGKFLESVSSVL